MNQLIGILREAPVMGALCPSFLPHPDGCVLNTKPYLKPCLSAGNLNVAIANQFIACMLLYAGKKLRSLVFCKGHLTKIGSDHGGKEHWCGFFFFPPLPFCRQQFLPTQILGNSAQILLLSLPSGMRSPLNLVLEQEQMLD